LNKTITIPPKSLKNPGQIDAGITALVSGADGNHGLDDFIFSKPSKALSGITVRSITEIIGGASGTDSLADPVMIQTVTEDLKNEFSNNTILVDRLSEQIPDTMMVLPIMLPENPVTITLDPKHEDGVRVIASQTVTILVVSRADVARILGDDLEIQKNMITTTANMDVKKESQLC
jgi:hypothetical protein